jgi:hypothetical protein
VKRIAILLEGSLAQGEASNVAAILMGQAAICIPEIYGRQPVRDKDGNHHASIRYSTVVLKAGRGQLQNLLHQARQEHPGVFHCAFTKTGQGLHNAFDQYESFLQEHSLSDLEVVGLILVGDEPEVRLLTKKFSVLRSSKSEPGQE